MQKAAFNLINKTKICLTSGGTPGLYWLEPWLKTIGDLVPADTVLVASIMNVQLSTPIGVSTELFMAVVFNRGSAKHVVVFREF